MVKDKMKNVNFIKSYSVMVDSENVSLSVPNIINYLTKKLNEKLLYILRIYRGIKNFVNKTNILCEKTKHSNEKGEKLAPKVDISYPLKCIMYFFIYRGVKND